MFGWLFIAFALIALVSFVYLLVRLIDDPEKYADLEKIRPVFGSKHLGIILQASLRLGLIIFIYILSHAGVGLFREYFRVPSVLKIVERTAESFFNHSYDAGYMSEAYPNQNFYEYLNYQKYAKWLLSREDISDFDEWFSRGHTNKEVEVAVSRYIRSHCSDYSDVRVVVSGWYREFQLAKRGNKH